MIHLAVINLEKIIKNCIKIVFIFSFSLGVMKLRRNCAHGIEKYSLF